MGSGASKTNSLSIEKLCEGLENGTYKKVIVMCGAGISTSAGIPDFRSPSTGLYERIIKRFTRFFLSTHMIFLQSV